MRRPLLRPFCGLLCLVATVGAQEAQVASKPPYRLIYSNDSTHLVSNTSPYHAAGEKGFTESMVRASVDEAAVPGMGAQMLQPGTGWVPWWPSKIDPIADHLAWYRAKYGEKEGHYPILDYLAQGGDFVGAFLDECRKRGDGAFVSFRLNDVHLLETAELPKPAYGGVYAISKFYVDHPEYRLGPPPPPPAQQGRGENWLLPEVRAYKLSLIKEIVTQYDLDGLELDFMRYPNYFPPETPLEERVKVMTGFIGEVRALLDASPAPGKRRWLTARVPFRKADPDKHYDWQAIGFDPAAFHQAGIDAFNLSPFYNTSQQTEIAAVRAAAPDAGIYLELTHTTQTWWIAVGKADGFDYRRSTKEMLETTARLAYRRGADGVTVFNYPYYREYGPVKEQRGPFNEPPFEALAPLADPAALEKGDRLYFFNMLKAEFTPGQSRHYTMDMFPPAAGHDGTLRLQLLTKEETVQGELPADAVPPTPDRGAWKVTLNGKLLAATAGPGTAYPFPTPFRAGFGRADQYLAWTVPAGVVKDGLNQVEVTCVKADAPLTLRWTEVWFDGAN